jgi:hypothetical protein
LKWVPIKEDPSEKGSESQEQASQKTNRIMNAKLREKPVRLFQPAKIKLLYKCLKNQKGTLTSGNWKHAPQIQPNKCCHTQGSKESNTAFSIRIQRHLLRNWCKSCIQRTTVSVWLRKAS